MLSRSRAALRLSTRKCYLVHNKDMRTFVTFSLANVLLASKGSVSNAFHTQAPVISFMTNKPTNTFETPSSFPISAKQQELRRSFHRRSIVMSERKAGVSSPEELKSFVDEAGEKLLVVDVRNPDAEAEPGDQKSLVVAGLPSETYRPQAVSLIWDRNTNSMPLPEVEDKDTPIITHCGGGGRGQKAKDFLISNGFTNVLNGGGPKETECWSEFGEK